MRHWLPALHLGCVLLVSTSGCAPPAHVATSAAARSADERLLLRATQDMLDAIAPGNKAVWERYLAEDALYTDENGKTYTKNEFLAELRPLPPGAQGSLRIKRSKVRFSGDHAVILHESDENERLYGQKLVARFAMTDTWRYRSDKGGRWELLASHVTGFWYDPPVAKLSPGRLDAHVGVYSIATGPSVTVRRDGDRLLATREGRPTTVLFPEADGIFFARGSSDRWVFVPDEAGITAELRQRRRGTDLVWRKTK